MALVELGFGETRVAKAFSIANGQTDSDEIDLGDFVSFALEMPAALTGTTFKIKAARAFGGTYNLVKDELGTDVSFTVGVDRVIPLDTLARVIAALRFVKFVSSAAEGGTRTFYIHARA